MVNRIEKINARIDSLNLRVRDLFRIMPHPVPAEDIIKAASEIMKEYAKMNLIYEGSWDYLSPKRKNQEAIKMAIEEGCLNLCIESETHYSPTQISISFHDREDVLMKNFEKLKKHIESRGDNIATIDWILVPDEFYYNGTGV